MTDRFLRSRRRRALLERAVAYKGGSCRICGYHRCLSALEFHHVSLLDKEFTISTRMTSWAAIKKELDKCELLCAVCHREVHDGLHVGYLVDEDSMRGQLDLDPLAEDFDTEPLGSPLEASRSCGVAGPRLLL
jgi:hypothetical protein